MAFCVNCGHELSAGAKFCSECGQAVYPKNDGRQRETVYEGNTYKCPNCGENLSALAVNCPICGHEVRGRGNSNAVVEFSKQLQALEKQMPATGKKQKTNSNGLTAIEEQKVSLISSFPIPNTKEDLLDFLVLAAANINEQRYGFDGISSGATAISDAWETKFDQAYQKAKISFGDSFDFKKIEALRTEKIAKISGIKKKKVYITTAIVCGIVLGLAVLIGGIFISDSRKINAENERLNAIVEEIYVYIQQEQYTLARSKASTLVFSGSTTMAGEQAEEKWGITRRELLEIINAAEYGSDYIPGPQEIAIGADYDDLKGENYLEVKRQLENRGFTNIKTEPINNLLTGWYTEEGSIEEITVNGEIAFTKSMTYLSDAAIVIQYHAKSSIKNSD